MHDERVWERLRQILGTVRLRQIIDQLRHRLSFVPGLYAVGGIFVAQLTLFIDRSLSDKNIPQPLVTTVDSARSVFSAIAGGLITSITLLLSMMLITIQLASSQFSPRTLRDWLGDKWLKNTVGLALGTTVFSLVALRSTRSLGEEGGEIVPHISVILAVVLGVVSLFGVVRSVDHVTQSVQVGTVARRIAKETIDVIEADDEVQSGQRPTQAPSSGHPTSTDESRSAGRDDIPDDSLAIEALTSGWVQQIRAASIVKRLPEGATGRVVTPLGAFVPSGTPLMWVTPAPPEDHECRVGLLEAFALGETRTMQQDVGFGILQLTDIAVRALSPGVNDPTTANDLAVHLGDVMLALWSRPVGEDSTEDDGRTLVIRRTAHRDHLRRGFDPIRRYGAADPTVLLTIVRTLRMVRAEVERRDLPGPTDPLDEMISDTIEGADTDQWAQSEIDELHSLADD